MAINLYSKASVDSLLTAKLSISSLTNAAATTLNATAPTTNQVLSFDGTELKWATVSGGGGVAWGAITGTLSDQTDLQSELDLKAPTDAPTFTTSLTSPSITLVGPSGSFYIDYSGLTFPDSSVQTSAAVPYTVNQKQADAIANLIYSQSSNSSGDLSVSNVPQFISNLTTNWGIVDGSATYYNCTGFSGATYSLSGTAGSGPYTVRVNGEDSSFTI